MWHQWFNRNFMKLLFVRKENKNNDFIQQFVSSASPYFGEYHIRKQCMLRIYADTLFTLFTLWSERKQRIRVHSLFMYVILSKIGWRGGDKLLNKVIIFVFFAHKKYSRSFVKLRLNHWCHMDYCNDVLAMFLSLDLVRILAVYGGSESSRSASKIS